MISYRKLAMRVLGHPLRVPSPRPASHRVTALALTAAMVAGMSSWARQRLKASLTVRRPSPCTRPSAAAMCSSSTPPANPSTTA